MKIAVVISVVGAVKRGGESTTLGLVSYLEKHASVQVLSGGPFSAQQVTNLGFPPLPRYTALHDRLPTFLQKWIRRFHVDPLSVRNLLFCRKVYPHLIKDLPDVVIFRSVGPWGIKTGRRLRALTGVPIVTIEGGWKKGEREVARYHPNLHIAVNPDVADYLRAQLPGVKIEHFPNGTNIARYSPSGPKADFQLPRPWILSCGSMENFKRFELAIQAVARLEKGSLLLLGQGELAEHYRQLGHQVLGDRFALASAPHDRMPDYYRAADIVTLPSFPESFGMVYIEAMACNKPVVATLDANRRKIVGDGGLLVDPTDIGAYAAALDTCLKTDFGERPRRQAERFDWEQVGPLYMRALESAAREKGQKGPFPVQRHMGD